MLYLIYFPPHLKYHRSLPLPTAPTASYGAADTSAAGTASAQPGHGSSGPLVNGHPRGLANGDDGDDDEEGTTTLLESVHGEIRPVQVSITTTAEWRQAVTVAVVVVLHV